MSQVTKQMLRGKITSFKMKNLIPNFLPKITKPLLLSNTPQLQVCANSTLSSFCHPLCCRRCSLRRVHPAELDAVNDAMRPLHNLSQHSMVMASFNQVIARFAFSMSCTRMNVGIIGHRCLTAVPAAQDRNAVLVICRANFSRMSQFCSLDYGKVTCFKRR